MTLAELADKLGVSPSACARSSARLREGAEGGQEPRRRQETGGTRRLIRNLHECLGRLDWSACFASVPDSRRTDRLVSGIAMVSKTTRRRTSIYEYFLFTLCAEWNGSCSGNGATSSERGAPVSYEYSFEDLLALLHGHAPAKVDAVALHRRRVEYGYLSGDSKSTVWERGVSSPLWWKVLRSAKKFSMSTTTNTPTPRCVLCCPRWVVLVRRYSFLSVSSTLLDLRFSVTRKSRSRYALQGDLALVVRHCWR